MKRFTKPFCKNESGSFLILFGLSFTVILYVSLLAMDYSNTENKGQELQQALDAVTVSLVTMEDITEHNIQQRGRELLKQKYPEFDNLQSIKFYFTNNGLGIRADAKTLVDDSYNKLFNKKGNVVSRASETTRSGAKENIEFVIFVDTSLTMGLPSTPYKRVEDIMLVDPADPTGDKCIFACHSGGTTARILGYETKLDVVTRGLKQMLASIQNVTGTGANAPVITYSLYRYQQGEIYTDLSKPWEPYYEITSEAWNWSDTLNRYDYDLNNVHETVPVDPLIVATTDIEEVKDHLDQTWDLVGGTNLNTPLQVIYDNLRFRNKVKEWVEADPSHDIKNVNALLADMPADIGIQKNRFFQALKHNDQPNAQQTLENMTNEQKKTLVIFISDGDHRRAPDQFDFQNCTNIKSLPDTTLYTFLIYNNPDPYTVYGFDDATQTALRSNRYTDEEPRINFLGHTIDGMKRIHDDEDWSKTYPVKNFSPERPLKGLGQYGYVYGLDFTEQLMKDCASSDAFFKGEFESELNEQFKALTKDLASQTTPRLTNSK